MFASHIWEDCLSDLRLGKDLCIALKGPKKERKMVTTNTTCSVQKVFKCIVEPSQLFSFKSLINVHKPISSFFFLRDSCVLFPGISITVTSDTLLSFRY